MNREDLRLLKEILNKPVEPIKVRCNMFITSLWRTVILSFTRLLNSSLRYLETNKSYAMKIMSRKPYLIALERDREYPFLVENSV